MAKASSVDNSKSESVRELFFNQKSLTKNEDGPSLDAQKEVEQPPTEIKWSPQKKDTSIYEQQKSLERAKGDSVPQELEIGGKKEQYKKQPKPVDEHRANKESQVVEPVQWNVKKEKGSNIFFQGNLADYSSPAVIAEDENQMFRLDENKNLVKSYFHDMLKYINRNDATLANDRDGDLAFFIKQMPEEEMSITFSEWIIRKRDALKKDLVRETDSKLEKLRKEFDRIIGAVNSIVDDDKLIALAEKLDNVEEK